MLVIILDGSWSFIGILRMPWGCENFQYTSDQQESYNKFGFRAGQYPQNVYMLLTSKEQPLQEHAQICNPTLIYLNVWNAHQRLKWLYNLGRWCNSDQFCYIMKPGVCLTNCLDPNNPTRYPSHTGRPWREVERSLRNASVFMIQTHSKRSDWWWLNQPLGEKIAQVKLDHFRFPQV